MRVLLVEDDPVLGESVAAYLRRSGFAVDVADAGEVALCAVERAPYDAIVLDLGLPGIDGLQVCRRLRAAGNDTRILMATARDAIDDRVLGLDTGADDYLGKPYALAELVARLRALLRRPADAVDVELRVADLVLDTRSRRARRGARAIELTTKEFALLETLIRHPGAVLTREHISEHAWDANYDPVSNVIDVYVARLRRKIDHPGETPLLETVRGAGYRLRVPTSEPAADDARLATGA